MIKLTRLNGKSFILNCEWIKTVEATPDTLITLTNGEKFMVREPLADVIDAAVTFRRRLFLDEGHVRGPNPEGGSP
ncbi:MAG: flagellar FlbD family protein [Bacteriovoracia bacterium]